jgi:hypothetical protein
MGCCVSNQDESNFKKSSLVSIILLLFYNFFVKLKLLKQRASNKPKDDWVLQSTSHLSMANNTSSFVRTAPDEKNAQENSKIFEKLNNIFYINFFYLFLLKRDFYYYKT